MMQRIARTGMSHAILILSLLVSASAAADIPTVSGDEPDATARWSAGDGVTSFRLFPEVLDPIGVSIRGSPVGPASEMPGDLEYEIEPSSKLDFWAPWAAFDGFATGQLRHPGHLTIEWPGGRLDIDGFVLQPAGPDALDLVDRSGNHLFRLDHLHTMLYPDRHLMTLRNMDMGLSPWLAERMGYPELAGVVVGSAYTRSSIEIPVGAQTEGTCTTPNWHNGNEFVNDVELITLGGIQAFAWEPNVRVAVAPSATLRNVGTADVPWYQKFTTVPPATVDDYPDPYSRDQHPFLVWAMYRVVNGIPQQIGQSGVKHAFFTSNSACTCSGGDILWSADSAPNGKGCEDLYGASTNNSFSDLGIRQELPASTGAFEQCGSVFAPDATPPGPCAPDPIAAQDNFDRRLVVAESELETADATYYFEGWYLVRDDVNIFNTMAHVSVTPTPPGAMWTFPSGPTQGGPAIDSWVSPDTLGATEAHAREATSHGHYSLAVKVTDLGGGNYRYVYALMNYDFDPKFESFSLAVPEGVSLSNIAFLDGDSSAANDWTSSTASGRLTFEAPLDAALEWGFMATFVFEADQPPVEGVVRLAAEEAPLSFNPLVLGLTDAIHLDGFEN